LKDKLVFNIEKDIKIREIEAKEKVSINDYEKIKALKVLK